MSRSHPSPTFSEAELTPPLRVSEAAAKGLELRERFHRGGTEVGEHRAEQLRDRRPIELDDIGRIYSYFQRHDVDHRPDWDDPEHPTPGYVAWQLWGGDAGRTWITTLHDRLAAETTAD